MYGSATGCHAVLLSHAAGGSVVGSSSSSARTVTRLLLKSLAAGSMRVKEPLSHLKGRGRVVAVKG